MRVGVPAGDHLLDLEFGCSELERAALAISLVTLVAWLVPVPEVGKRRQAAQAVAAFVVA